MSTAPKTAMPTFKVLEFPALEPEATWHHANVMLSLYTDPSDLHDDIQAGCDALVVVDARSREAYESGHIPGAINFPHREIDAKSVRHRLPKDKLIITYCDGLGCNASTKGALKLAFHGFRVKELLGGINWWVRDGYSLVRGRDPGPGAQCGC